MQKQLDEASKQSQERSRIYRRTSHVAKRDRRVEQVFFEVNDGMDDIRTIRGDPRVANEQHRRVPSENRSIKVR